MDASDWLFIASSNPSGRVKTRPGSVLSRPGGLVGECDRDLASDAIPPDETGGHEP